MTPAPVPPVDTTVLPPILVGDDPALDLVNSRAYPGGRCVEWLSDPEALDRWMTAAGLGDAAERSAALGDGRGAAALDRVLALREWLREFVARHAGSPLRDVRAGELAALNDELARDDSYDQLAAPAGDVRRVGPRYRRAEEAIVQPVARAAAAFVCTADFTRVRQCESADCTLWFLDTTKAGTRRWCSMAICGNRAKARAHRARH